MLMEPATAADRGTVDQVAQSCGDLAVGCTFAVVPAEVKKLAQDTRAATEEITATIASLGREAEMFVAEIGAGAVGSRPAGP